MADEPAFRFPAIGTKYSRPIGEWQAPMRRHPSPTLMGPVAAPKDDHHAGHGHADAMVAQIPAADRA